jgi:hypothetical protein
MVPDAFTNRAPSYPRLVCGHYPEKGLVQALTDWARKKGSDMSNFYTDVIKKDSRFGSLKPIHDLALLEPVTRTLVLAIIADAAAAGIKLMA